MRTCPACDNTYSEEIEFCPRDGARLMRAGSESDAELVAGLARRFRIVRRLGEGGMGAVYLAEQVAVGHRPVALKVLLRKLLDDPGFLQRFQDEAASTGRIRHPNVVTIYESGQSEEGQPYIAMEFLEGETLRHVLKERGALPVAECAEILQQSARGLNAAHKLGTIHRDLKPDNLFLTRGDEGELIVKLVDFGIAKLRESSPHTLTGAIIGTPAYISSEQASGMRSDQLDARSDIYSLGVVTYEMLTGRVPFKSDTPLGYARKHLHEDPPPLRSVKPELPELDDVERVVMKALAKDRNRRYSSVMDFAREFVHATAAGDHREPTRVWKPGRGLGGAAVAIKPFALERTLTGDVYAVSSVAFSPNGDLLASCGYDHTIKLWDVASGALRQTLAGHSQPVFSVAFSPDGKFLASGSADTTIKLWDAASGAQKKTLAGQTAAVHSVAFSPNGKLLATGKWDNTVTLWDMATGAQRKTLKGHSQPVYSVAFSPDGRLLASGSGDKTVILWDVASGTQAKTLAEHNIGVICVAFSPDGESLASRSGDSTINLWDAASGTLRLNLTGHSNYVWSLAFGPEGGVLASGSVDKTIKLWDVASGGLKQTLKGHDDSVWCVAFSPDGKLLASGSADQTIMIWRMAE